MKNRKCVFVMAALSLLLSSCKDYENPVEGDVQKVEVNGVDVELVYVAPATFQMGATTEQEGFDAHTERPIHTVTLTKGYWVGKTEVTQQLWQAVMGTNPSSAKEYEGKKNDMLPVCDVTWMDCKKFCEKLSALTGKKFRLPTEAEWEYAARGAGKTFGIQYSGSKYLENVACFRGNSNGYLHPVALFMPNELDIRDMNGNVSEWVMDNFEVYKDLAMTDPCIFTADTLSHVARGGNFTSTTTQCRTSSRENYDFDVKSVVIGLRIVMEK